MFVCYFPGRYHHAKNRRSPSRPVCFACLPSESDISHVGEGFKEKNWEVAS